MMTNASKRVLPEPSAPSKRTISGMRPAYRGALPAPVRVADMLPQLSADETSELAPVTDVQSLWQSGRSEADRTLEVAPDLLSRLAETTLPSDRPTPVPASQAIPAAAIPPAPPLPRLPPIGATPSAPLVVIQRPRTPIPWYPSPVIQTRSASSAATVMTIVFAAAAFVMGSVGLWTLYRFLSAR